jgi:hypothetical protein
MAKVPNSLHTPPSVIRFNCADVEPLSWWMVQVASVA